MAAYPSRAPRTARAGRPGAAPPAHPRPPPPRPPGSAPHAAHAPVTRLALELKNDSATHQRIRQIPDGREGDQAPRPELARLVVIARGAEDVGGPARVSGVQQCP